VLSRNLDRNQISTHGENTLDQRQRREIWN
jgi:hypothetical protein